MRLEGQGGLMYQGLAYPDRLGLLPPTLHFSRESNIDVTFTISNIDVSFTIRQMTFRSSWAQRYHVSSFLLLSLLSETQYPNA